jgi:uncharacterized membrane protein YphA (DoxX/SURF4 family)
VGSRQHPQKGASRRHWPTERGGGIVTLNRHLVGSPVPVRLLPVLSQVYWLAAVSLILGLATRVGAAVLLALTVASHIRVAALDLHLFWMALLAHYVLLGADRLSLDRLNFLTIQRSDDARHDEASLVGG